jgi:hypothetical protein
MRNSLIPLPTGSTSPISPKAKRSRREAIKPRARSSLIRVLHFLKVPVCFSSILDHQCSLTTTFSQCRSIKCHYSTSIFSDHNIVATADRCLFLCRKLDANCDHLSYSRCTADFESSPAKAFNLNYYAYGPSQADRRAVRVLTVEHFDYIVAACGEVQKRQP